MPFLLYTAVTTLTLNKMMEDYWYIYLAEQSRADKLTVKSSIGKVYFVTFIADVGL